MAKRTPIPKILLIGAGRFGQNHLRVLRGLEEKKKITLVGIVVRSQKSKKAVEGMGIRQVYTQLTPALLKRVDAAVIVTPISTHAALLKKCLPYIDVFVEKPIIETEREEKDVRQLAAKYARKIMVGHIYRFDPLVEQLKTFIVKEASPLWKISGQLTKPEVDDTGESPALEFLHHADVMDYIFGKEPTVSSKRTQGRVEELSLRYPGHVDAILILGWIGVERVNYLAFTNGEVDIRCDFLLRKLTISRGENSETLTIESKSEPLKKELETFVSVIQSKKNSFEYPDMETGLRVARASRGGSTPKVEKKRIAIIGAGLFGATAALKVSELHEVTVFERNNDIMTEASFVNQYRHHWGYHYPRSSETVKDIRKAIGDFEEMYEAAIIRNFPTYYAIAKEGSKVSAEEYIAFCKKHELPYEIEFPESSFVNEKATEVSLKTMEPIYDYSKLREIVKKNLVAQKNVTLKFNSPVIGGYLAQDGTKVLMYQENGVMRSAEFEYVVNITYANYNLFASWFNFLRKKIRVDLVEALIMKIPIPRMSFAIMDGPFTNVVPTEQENIFTLVHIKESVLHRFVPADGLIPPGLTYVSNAKKIIDESMKWLPILKKAEYLESRYVFRSVNAGREHDDARPSDVTYHGFGCWSVLGGKIVNCVTTAKQIAADIAKDD
jgi:RNase P protein component